MAHRFESWSSCLSCRALKENSRPESAHRFFRVSTGKCTASAGETRVWLGLACSWFVSLLLVQSHASACLFFFLRAGVPNHCSVNCVNTGLKIQRGVCARVCLKPLVWTGRRHKAQPCSKPNMWRCYLFMPLQVHWLLQFADA